MRARTTNPPLGILIVGLFGAACSSSPTDPTTRVEPRTQGQVDTVVKETASTSDTIIKADIQCRDFGLIRSHVRLDGDDLVIYYAFEDVPFTGFYYLRFWLHGRHIGQPADFEIGDLEKGDDKSGSFRLEVGPVDRDTTFDYNISIEAVDSRDDYKKGATDLVQCDSGGSITVTPPRETPNCNVATSIGGIDYVVRSWADIDVLVSVHARNFTGVGKLIWLKNNSPWSPTEVTTRIDAGCGDTMFDFLIEWKTDGLWLLNPAYFVVQILDDQGRVVKEERYPAPY